MKNNPNNIVIKYFVALTVMLTLYQKNAAQLKGDHLLGDVGLQSGSQPPPSFTVILPVYNYHTSTFISASGNKIDAPDVNSFLTGAGAAIVIDKKILGGNYGASVLFAFATNKIDGGTISSKTSFA